MNRFTLPGFAIAMLLVVFCCRIWDVAPTHTDDAIWRVAGNQGNWQIIVDWAKSQGRIFAFLTGALIFVGTTLQGTTLGSFLQVGTFALFFISFHSLLRVYFSTKLAMMTAVVNLALYSIRWEGSVVTTYPLFASVLSTAFVASIYLGWQYSKSRRSVFLWTSLPCFYLSLNIHEGMSLLFSFLAVLAVFGNYWRNCANPSRIATIIRDSYFKQQMIGTVVVIGLYFGGYLAWRLANPSQYDGNKLGSFNPLDVAPVLFSLSASGSIFVDCFRPYKVNFADAIGHDGYGIVYQPLNFLVSQGSTLALLSAVCVAVTSLSLSTQRDSVTNDSLNSDEETPNWIPSLLTGFAIAIVPVLPVALVGKYQEHFYKLDVRSYAFTPICHFGWSIVLAFVLLKSERTGTRKWPIAVLIACFLGTLGYSSTLRNEAAVADIRRETCRWKVIERLTKILPCLSRTITTVHAPRLRSGSWFSVVNADYWESYTKSCLNQSLKFNNDSIARSLIGPGLAYVDYHTSNDGRQSIVFAALLEVDSKTGQVIASEVGVLDIGLDPSARAQFQLQYRDIDRGLVFCRFSQMSKSPIEKRVQILSNLRAVPSSIHISEYSEVHDLNIEAGDRMTVDSSVRFGFESGPLGGDSGVKWLADGWHPQERSGTWSSKTSSKMTVPIDIKQHGNLSANIMASTLTGLGFCDRPQIVQLRIGDRIAATQNFDRGSGFLSLPFEINQGDPDDNGKLEIHVEISDIVNPAQMGLSSDARDLGVMLQNLTIRRSSE